MKKLRLILEGDRHDEGHYWYEIGHGGSKCCTLQRYNPHNASR